MAAAIAQDVRVAKAQAATDLVVEVCVSEPAQRWLLFSKRSVTWFSWVARSTATSSMTSAALRSLPV